MAAIVGAVLSISMFTALPAAISPACADTVTAGDGATATVADIVAGGSAIHIEGTGWTHPTNGTGSTIGVKLGDAVTTEPASGPVINPATGTSADSVPTSPSRPRPTPTRRWRPRGPSAPPIRCDC
ncbi:MAG: hypothetical protein J0H06_16490 [Actinobacteria bacterium]|nr:hypothetical protein [Actinomycetota bacterium]